MARQTWEEATEVRPNGPATYAGNTDQSLGELLQRLSRDTGNLIQQEMALARAEAAQIAQNVRAAATSIAIAAAFALTGLLTLAAFATIALGNALDGRYWLSALIVAVVVLIAAALLGKRASAKLSPDQLKPRESIQGLKRDAAWAGREAKELKRDLSGRTTINHRG